MRVLGDILIPLEMILYKYLLQIEHLQRYDLMEVLLHGEVVLMVEATLLREMDMQQLFLEMIPSQHFTLMGQLALGEMLPMVDHELQRIHDT